MGASSETHVAVDQKKQKDHHFLKKFKGKGVLLKFTQVLYVVLCVICVIAALALLVVTASTTLLTKTFDSEATGRIVGSIALMVSAVIAVAVVNYGIYAICKKNNKHLIAVSNILAIVVVIQILVLVFSIQFKREDDIALENSLTASFKRAHHDFNKTDIVHWNILQHSFNCCGLQGPNDYRNPDEPFVPPRVPFSCCADYKENLNETASPWDRDKCIIKGTYFKTGCLEGATTVFKGASMVTIKMSIFLMVPEALVLAVGFCLGIKQRVAKHKNNDPEPGPFPVA